MDYFTDHVRNWFGSTFGEPTPVQANGWPSIAAGRHALLLAPTGSGKTLAAFLWSIDQLSKLPADADKGVRVVYVSPLKALVYDVDRNLRAPLVGVRRTAELAGETPRPIQVDVRTGDTSQRERQRQLRQPGEILVTTPESLYLLLSSRARENFRSVQTVIVDEVHALAPTKRGVHLALSLERLAEAADEDPQRIGLSATVRPPEEVARFLGGDRAVEIVDTSKPPALDVKVIVPVPDMENVVPPTPQPRQDEGGSILAELYRSQSLDPGTKTPETERGMWSAIYPELVDEIRNNRSTIIFVNSRGLCERLAQRLNDIAEENLVRSHHGSISHEERREIEEALKAGRLKGIVATSSLELGIDMGAVDRVILVESPGSVARGLQRVGRAGHQVGETSSGRIYPKYRGDLLEAAVITARMSRGEIESIGSPQNVLDVLAQQIVAMVCDTPRQVDELEKLILRAHPYRELTSSVLHATLDMLSGKYPSADFADLRPRLNWDRATDTLTPRRGSPMIVRLNAGTIPDRGLYGVYVGSDGPRVGELDEEMVFESKAGDTFTLGASTWRVEEITRDRVVVSPAPGENGRLPFWRGDGPGRPIELGRALGAFVRELDQMKPEEATRWLAEQSGLDELAAKNLQDYLAEQREHTGTLPTDRGITIERFRDELGDWRICILTPFGSRIHAPWALAIQSQLVASSGFEIQVMYTDDGLVVRMADTDELPEVERLIPDPDELEELLTNELADSALFTGLFRENAARALLLPRRRPDKRNPLWAQRIKAKNLLATVRRYPGFPIVLETYRQCMADVFDLPGLTDLLRRIRSREIRVEEVETRNASPFARSLVYAWVGSYMYETDTPIAERRAQALTLDRGLLRELLGHAELRDLIDAEVLDELEAILQARIEERQVGDADGIHDLLRRLGDLSDGELVDRCQIEPLPALRLLEDQRRVAQIAIGGESRWIAAEDAGLYRDALGCMPPSGLPDAFLEPVDDALDVLLRRYARGRGPFLTREAARRFGVRDAPVHDTLRRLEQDGTLVRGELRPGGNQVEWCDADVLRRLKRMNLAKLRHQVAPVDASTLGLFLPQWHGIGDARGSAGSERLEEVVLQLEGLPLPWSELSKSILPSRVRDFRLEQLDALAASGWLTWIGAGALGTRDGKIVLVRREQANLLLAPPEVEERSEAHQAVLEHLRQRGASFTVALHQVAAAADASIGPREMEQLLWDLVWDGQITNDTFQPFRGLGRGARRTTTRRPGRSWMAAGRWSTVAELLQPEVSDTERLHARARCLMERYGLLSREGAGAEAWVGRFGPIYRVLKAMEDAGRIRRGYFVEGLSGAQFALPGAVDRLRACKVEDRTTDTEPLVSLLPAVDPANPYGALFSWPDTAGGEDQRPRRVPGAWVVLVDGHPLLYLAPRGRKLLTFRRRHDEPIWRLAFEALAEHGRGQGRLPRIETIDGAPAKESRHYALMLTCGFERDYRGLSVAPHR